MAPRTPRHALPLLPLLLLAALGCAGRGALAAEAPQLPDIDKILGAYGLADHPAARQLMGKALGGPLPGLTYIPGFPGDGGRRPVSLSSLAKPDLERLARIGVLRPLSKGGSGLGGGGLGGGVAGGAGSALGAAALATYVIEGEDPVAIALRQLSIVAIGAYGTAVSNVIGRAVVWIDAELARYSAFLSRQVDALEDANLEPLLFAVQREIRELVILQAALVDIEAKLLVYVDFLSGATASWVSLIYGIQYRFQSLIINIDWQNDPFSVEINRVLYSLSDVEKLIGLLLKPFITASEFAQSFFSSLLSILQNKAIVERNRLTVTPTIALEDELGSGENLKAVIDEIVSLTEKVGSGDNAAALLQAASSARDQVLAALADPAGGGAGGGKNASGGGLGEALLARMAGGMPAASDAKFFKAASG